MPVLYFPKLEMSSERQLSLSHALETYSSFSLTGFASGVGICFEMLINIDAAVFGSGYIDIFLSLGLPLPCFY